MYVVIYLFCYFVRDLFVLFRSFVRSLVIDVALSFFTSLVP